MPHGFPAALFETAMNHRAHPIAQLPATGIDLGGPSSAVEGAIDASGMIPQLLAHPI
jgi:hypothetical protein